MEKLLPFFIFFLLIPACTKDSVTNPVVDPTYKISYTFTGNTSSGSATYAGEGGSTLQQDPVYPGWSYIFNAKKGDFLYVSVQNNKGQGTVTVNIYVNDKLYKTATSIGAYVIATASGNAE